MKVKNKTAFIIGTGPSLKDVDVSLLKDYTTITFNRAYIAFEEWGFEPTYYLAIDGNDIRSIYKDINNLILNSNIERFFLYKVNDIKQKEPNLNDKQTRNDIIELVFQKNKFDYNRDLLEKIRNKKFNNNDFLKMSEGNIETAKINSVKDNKKFDINAIEILYTLPIDSFTLIND